MTDTITFRLSPEARAALDEIGKLRGGVSAAEVLRRALGTELCLLKARDQGCRVLLSRWRGFWPFRRREYRQVVWPGESAS